MNTEGLKPIDARVMKPGDPVVNGYREPIAHGYLVEYNPTVDPSVSTVIRWQAGGIATCYPDGRYGKGVPPGVFLPPDPAPIDPSPGNVDKLRKSQVGEGWRIPAHDEQPDKRAEWWDREKWNGGNIAPRKGNRYSPVSTYRVPIAPIRMVPLSMEDFIGKPWPWVRVENGCTVYVVCGLHKDGLWAGDSRTYINWGNLRNAHELSHDHGVTWVKAEKEEQT